MFLNLVNLFVSQILSIIKIETCLLYDVYNVSEMKH